MIRWFQNGLISQHTIDVEQIETKISRLRVKLGFLFEIFEGL